MGEYAPGGGSHWAFVGAAQVEEMTAAALPHLADWSFEQIRERFTNARAALVSLDEQLPADTRLAGYSLGSALVIRAFETWTHYGDIAAALGRVEVPADAPVLHTMAELAVQTLPVSGAHRSRRDERSGWRRLDDRVHRG